MTYQAERVRHFGTTIFTEMTQLANQYKAINLGQGFPDFAAPAYIKEAAVAAINEDINQYAPGSGRPALREALATKMAQHYGVNIDPSTQITVTCGATEAIFAAILGVVNPGDEVILFEPTYDSYLPAVQFAGGIPRFYTLRQPDWRLDLEKLATLFNEKTKVILINTPHNPTGKLFSKTELAHIAILCQQHDVIAMVDEVYEHIIFDGHQHVSMAAIEGMADRTITISSLGKTFSVTGWKIGWAIAAPDLNQAVFRAHQFMTFCSAAPLQEAAAAALNWAAENSYYAQLAQLYQQKRDYLVTALEKANLAPIQPWGTYFVMADISHLDFEHDVAFCHYLTKEIGVTAIPPSAFYHQPEDGAGLARFAFCKTDTVLAAAAARLSQLGK